MSVLEDLARRVIGSWEDGDLAQAVHDLDVYLREQDELRAAHEGTIQAAVANFEEDDCQVGSDPILSVAEDAVWVQAWVRVEIEDALA